VGAGPVWTCGSGGDTTTQRVGRARCGAVPYKKPPAPPLTNERAPVPSCQVPSQQPTRLGSPARHPRLPPARKPRREGGRNQRGGATCTIEKRAIAAAVSRSALDSAICLLRRSGGWRGREEAIERVLVVHCSPCPSSPSSLLPGGRIAEAAAGSLIEVLVGSSGESRIAGRCSSSSRASRFRSWSLRRHHLVRLPPFSWSSVRPSVQGFLPGVLLLLVSSTRLVSLLRLRFRYSLFSLVTRYHSRFSVPLFSPYPPSNYRSFDFLQRKKEANSYNSKYQGTIVLLRKVRVKSGNSVGKF
jgi:hypothetical protein